MILSSIIENIRLLRLRGRHATACLAIVKFQLEDVLSHRHRMNELSVSAGDGSLPLISVNLDSIPKLRTSSSDRRPFFQRISMVCPSNLIRGQQRISLRWAVKTPLE
jgi:hypothetical protein